MAMVVLLLGSDARIPMYPPGVAQPSRFQRLADPDGPPMTDWQPDGCAYCAIAAMVPGAACARHGLSLFSAVEHKATTSLAQTDAHRDLSSPSPSTTVEGRRKAS